MKREGSLIRKKRNVKKNQKSEKMKEKQSLNYTEMKRNGKVERKKIMDIGKRKAEILNRQRKKRKRNEERKKQKKYGERIM